MFRTPNNGLRKHARDNSENTITDKILLFKLPVSSQLQR